MRPKHVWVAIDTLPLSGADAELMNETKVVMRTSPECKDDEGRERRARGPRRFGFT